MTPDRAKQLIHDSNQWPKFGKFDFTPTEREEIDRLWLAASELNGNLSRAHIVHRIARGADPITGAD